MIKTLLVLLLLVLLLPIFILLLPIIAIWGFIGYVLLIMSGFLQEQVDLLKG